jgi:hypothetical protein
MIYGKRTASMVDRLALRTTRDGVETLSYAAHKVDDATYVPLYPAVTRLDNTQGGETVVFGGTPDAPFVYYAFSMLGESRKRQFVEILSRRGHLPIYYPEDAEVYLRAGTLPTGEIFCAFFNLTLDELEDIPLVCEKPVTSVEYLTPDGTRAPLDFTVVDGVVRIQKAVRVLDPVILLIK